MNITIIASCSRCEAPLDAHLEWCEDGLLIVTDPCPNGCTFVATEDSETGV